MTENSKNLSSSRAKAVVCWETGEVFPNANAAAEAVGLHGAASIYKAIRELCVAGGFHWYRADQPKPDASALGSGLKRPVICIETGEEFESLTAASCAMGLEVSISVLWAAIRYGRLFGGYHWRYKDNPKPKSSEFKTPRRPQTRAVVCWETGETYENALAAAEAVGLRGATSINKAIRERCTAGGYHWYRADQPKPDESELGQGRERPVICVETGEVYGSVAAAARAAGVKYASQLSNAIRDGGEAGGFHWRFKGEPEYEAGKTDQESTALQETNDASHNAVRTDDSSTMKQKPTWGRKARPVVCIETGIIYESSLDAAAAVGLKRSASVQKAARTGTMSGGHHWRYAD